jgi:hypothetical protein
MVLPDFAELRRRQAEDRAAASSSLASVAQSKKTASEKNKPLEFSCRRTIPVPKRLRQGLLPKRSEVSDPRFNEKIVGDFVASRLASDYSFLNDYRDAERVDLETRMQSRKTSLEDKEQISKTLTRMVSQDVARRRAAAESEVLEELRSKELELIEKTGKKPYFHPKSAVKNILKQRNEESLRKSGKFEKFMAQKERRDVAKERKNSFGAPKTRRIVEA